MDLLIDDPVLVLFPDLVIGIVVAEGITNSPAVPDLEQLKRDASACLRTAFTPETLQIHPNIVAWRETYRRFGVKPKEHRPTAEALLRRLLKGGEIPTISAVVDSYLVVETEYLLPIGGYDLDKVSGDVSLVRSPGGEPFVPIGSPRGEVTDAGEIVYRDAARVLTRRWNYRDADATKITEDSRNVALFVEAALREVPTSDVEESVARMAEYVGRFCGGSISQHIVLAQEARSLTLR
jgi:DNA/RNA-binding domain of Phe-tRNA-synthetase-like protein